jgi:hypothetical protein
MIQHQLRLMPRENTAIRDPLALDDELVVPKAPASEPVNQEPYDFENTPMVNALASKFLSIHLTCDVIHDINSQEVDEAGGSTTSYPELKIYNASPSKRKKSLNKG